MRHQTSTRRAVLLLGAIAMSLTLGACAAPTPPSQPSQPSQPTADNPTPAAQTCAQARPTRSADGPVATAVASMIACVPPAEPAPAMTEGPYFKQGSPVRQSLLEPTTAGEKLVLSGNVLSTGDGSWYQDVVVLKPIGFTAERPIIAIFSPVPS